MAKEPKDPHGGGKPSQDPGSLVAQAEALSRSINRAYQARERREIESLRAEIGNGVVEKLDMITTRDLVHTRREAQFRALLGAEGEDEGARHRVLLTGKPRLTGGDAVGRKDDRRAKRRARLQIRAGNTLLTKRITAGVSEHGGVVRQTFWLVPSVSAELTPSQLVALAARSDVHRVSHDKQTIIACLDVSRPLIQADQVEALGFDGSGVDVAVIDTGCDFTHAALSPVAGSSQDFTGEGTGDLYGHGTHCAGVIASQDRKYRGIAPGCTVHEYKIMDLNGSSTTSIAISGVQQAVADGRDVLSNSWGWSHADGAWTCPDGTCVLCQAANAAALAGSVFVASAGNANNDTCSSYDTHIGCPGHATDAITVAASDDSDNMASFSSVGPAADGRSKPDITAPGVDIVSARSSTGSDMGGSAPVVDKVWSEASGTSMSAPHIAGVCALMLDKNGGLTPANVKSILMKTAVDIGAAPESMGAGRVDALAAVNAS